MFIQSKMVTFLFLIFLGCSAVAEERENCDRVQFSFDNPYDKKNNQSFTKQSFERNGQPVYYSFHEALGGTLIWRSSENTTWESQTRQYTSNKITKTKTKISDLNLFLFFSKVMSNQDLLVSKVSLKYY